MDGRIKLSKTGVFLLVLTALFLLSVGTVYLLTPRTTQGDYMVEAQAPSEKPKTDKVNINTADADELDALPWPPDGQRAVHLPGGSVTGERHRADHAGWSA